MKKKNKPQWDDGQDIEEIGTSPSWDDGQDIEDIGYAESGLRGTAQGLTMGSIDEITGFLESLISDKSYEEARDESRSAYKEAEEANPGTYMAGDVAGSIGTMFVPGLGLAKGASLAAQTGKLGALGVAEGFGRSEEDTVSGLAKDAIIGGTIGAVAPGAIKGIGKAAKGIGAAAEGAKKVLPGVEGSATNKVAAGTQNFLYGTGEDASHKAADMAKTLDNESSAIMGKHYAEGERQFYNSLDSSDIKKMNPNKFNHFRKLIEKDSGELSGSKRTIENTLNIISKGPIKEVQESQGKTMVEQLQAGISKNKIARTQGERLVAARRYLSDTQKNKNWDNMMRGDRELIDKLKRDINKQIDGTSGGHHLKDVDTLYSKFTSAKTNALNKIEAKSPSGVREITPEKMGAWLKSDSNQAKYIDRSMSEFEKVLKQLTWNAGQGLKGGGLESIKDFREISKMKRTIDSLSATSGGPTSQAINIAMQAGGAYSTSGLSLLAIPLTNPALWLRILDGAGPAAKPFLEKIAKVAKVVASKNPKGAAQLMRAIQAQATDVAVE